LVSEARLTGLNADVVMYISSVQGLLDEAATDSVLGDQSFDDLDPDVISEDSALRDVLSNLRSSASAVALEIQNLRVSLKEAKNEVKQSLSVKEGRDAQALLLRGDISALQAEELKFLTAMRHQLAHAHLEVSGEELALENGDAEADREETATDVRRLLGECRERFAGLRRELRTSQDGLQISQQRAEELQKQATLQQR
jgi:hypothetical protein